MGEGPQNTHCGGTDWKILSYSVDTNRTIPLTSQNWRRQVNLPIFRTSTLPLSKAFVQDAGSNGLGTQEEQRLSKSRQLLISSCCPVRANSRTRHFLALHKKAHFFVLVCSCFWLCCTARGILVPWPGIEPAPPALEAQSLNPCTARDVPKFIFKKREASIVYKGK